MSAAPVAYDRCVAMRMLARPRWAAPAVLRLVDSTALWRHSTQSWFGALKRLQMWWQLTQSWFGALEHQAQLHQGVLNHSAWRQFSRLAAHATHGPVRTGPAPGQPQHGCCQAANRCCPISGQKGHWDREACTACQNRGRSVDSAFPMSPFLVLLKRLRTEEKELLLK